MSDKHRLLLAEARRLYDQHGAGRQEPFNVFSVLRSESDEVNLHSRFLHALLNYRKPGEETRANLTDFLQHVGVKDFESSDVQVERERDNIDILVTNKDTQQAVVIENKIWAGDQPEQLRRYHDDLQKQEYHKIHLLYLTLYGHAPSEDSVGNLKCAPIPISYKYDLPPWLERCQKRAYDEPGLRESVAQYLELVHKLTGTNFNEAYMKELTKLCLEGNNLILVHNLNEAMTDARVCLLEKLWVEIDCALNEEISDLPPKNEDGEYAANSVSNERIKCLVTNRRRAYHGLYYSFGSGVGSISVEAGNGVGLIFGVRCHKGHGDERSKLDEALRDLGGKPSEWWPWYQEDDLNLKNSSSHELMRLLNQADRKEHAKGIAQRLKPIWDAVKATGLT